MKYIILPIIRFIWVLLIWFAGIPCAILLCLIHALWVWRLDPIKAGIISAWESDFQCEKYYTDADGKLYYVIYKSGIDYLFQIPYYKLVEQ